MASDEQGAKKGSATIKGSRAVQRGKRFLKAGSLNECKTEAGRTPLNISTQEWDTIMTKTGKL